MARPYITFTLSLLIPFVYAAATTAGPNADVSIKDDQIYVGARSCAAGCIWYNGIWHPSNAGYQDLAIHLECGAGAINACYCRTDFASSVTAYLHTCVSARCDAVVNPGVEVTSMIDFYNGYCATANKAVAAVTTPDDPYATSTSTYAATTGAAAVTGVSSTSRTVIAAPATASAATSTSAPAAAEGEKEDEGLGTSDIVALAVSLGIGIPSLVIGAATLWMMRRKKQRGADAAAAEQSGMNAGGPLLGMHQGYQMTGSQ